MTNTPTDKKWHPAIVRRARDLRQPLTPQEQKLWRRLRNRQLFGLKFRRQHPIGPFVVDFFCHQHRLVVEIDGHHHAEPEQQRQDEARTAWLEEEQALRIIRFSNREVDRNIEGVLVEIARMCGLDLSA
jgi:very-short-patch-repair endonuclease